MISKLQVDPAQTVVIADDSELVGIVNWEKLNQFLSVLQRLGPKY